MSEKKSGLGKFQERQALSAGRAEKEGGASSTADGKKKQLLVYLQPEGIRALKIAAAETDTSASAIVAEALNEWFQKNGRPPVA